MNSFRTEIFPDKPGFKINLHENILLLGSCFAQNIGRYLENYCLPVNSNPFGVLYNPISVINAIDQLYHKKEYTDEDLDFHDEQWFSYDHYSAFSHPDKTMCLKHINEKFNEASGFIGHLNYLVITLGTSWAYFLKRSGKVVANCHKVPAKEFERVFISKDEIVVKFQEMIDRILARQKGLKIIFTVSPIRHLKDGAHGNLLSKSNLVLAIHELEKKFNNVSYFPAYEIMMDDLRDYRFYAHDMLHPNEQAIQYIWQKFAECYFTDHVHAYFKEMDKLLKALNHSPNNSKSPKYMDFLKHQVNFAATIEEKYKIDLAKYRNNLKNQLI